MTLKKAYLLVLAAFCWLILGVMVTDWINPPTTSIWRDVLIGGCLVIFGFILLAATTVWAGAKGYHPLLGVALAWLGPLGLLILVFLPNRKEP